LASSSRFSNRAIDCSTSRRVAAEVADARARTPVPERALEREVERAVEREPERAVDRVPERALDFAGDLLVDLRAAGMASPCVDWTSAAKLGVMRARVPTRTASGHGIEAVRRAQIARDASRDVVDGWSSSPSCDAAS
jgi:hypothetical protein